MVSKDSVSLDHGDTEQIHSSSGLEIEPEVETVSQAELNLWRRGFTPQAEIWNGRLAMIGLSAGLSVLLISKLLLDAQR